nr:MAG TPA: hypothetical protein [Ackermannviridae sp.]
MKDKEFFVVKINKIRVGSRSTEFTLVDYPTMDD